jgi:hypothetical protein
MSNPIIPTKSSQSDSPSGTKLKGYERIKETARKFYDAKIHNNPEFREKEKQRVREYMNNRYNTDPEYAEKKKQQRRERYYINKQKLLNTAENIINVN